MNLEEIYNGLKDNQPIAYWSQELMFAPMVLTRQLEILSGNKNFNIDDEALKEINELLINILQDIIDGLPEKKEAYNLDNIRHITMKYDNLRQDFDADTLACKFWAQRPEVVKSW